MRKKDNDDDDFEDGMLKDGHTFRVPVRMLDSLQRDVAKRANSKREHVTDQFGGAGLGLHRPGFRQLTGGNALVRDAAQRDADKAYDEWNERITNAWKIDEGADDSLLDADFENTERSVDEYSRYDNELRNAWRGNK